MYSTVIRDLGSQAMTVTSTTSSTEEPLSSSSSDGLPSMDTKSEYPFDPEIAAHAVILLQAIRAVATTQPQVVGIPVEDMDAAVVKLVATTAIRTLHHYGIPCNIDEYLSSADEVQATAEDIDLETRTLLATGLFLDVNARQYRGRGSARATPKYKMASPSWYNFLDMVKKG